MGDLKKEIMSSAVAGIKMFRGDNKHIKDFIDAVGTDLYKMDNDFNLPDFKEGIKQMDLDLKNRSAATSGLKSDISDSISKLDPTDVLSKFDSQPIFSSVLSKIQNKGD